MPPPPIHGTDCPGHSLIRPSSLARATLGLARTSCQLKHCAPGAGSGGFRGDWTPEPGRGAPRVGTATALPLPVPTRRAGAARQGAGWRTSWTKRANGGPSTRLPSASKSCRASGQDPADRTSPTYSSRTRRFQRRDCTGTATPTMLRVNYRSRNAPHRAPAQ